MLKTARYDVINGERIFRKFDRLNIDPMATMQAARNAVSAEAVIEAARRVQFIVENHGEASEYLAAVREFEALKLRYRVDCQRYAKNNPVHFEPRRNEILI